ncbi:MAG: 6-phosphofructokinase [Gemmatimonadetes bacterium]|nr:6-phosphofructokinase [Gemmatimonadota bacterium]
MRSIAVLTSGGDAPGMNAAIRAVVRAGIGHGLRVYGVTDGYQGLIDGRIRELTARDVGGIMQLGGTMLGSARCEEFRKPDGADRAIRKMREASADSLVVNGGNGSQTGTFSLHEKGFPVVGIASTIDNDLVGSDITIGVDTALNVALQAVDMLKTTASSHRRAFLVEVMGRDCGYLALMTGIAGGAEVVCIPEVVTTPQEVADGVAAAYERGNRNAIVIVAEGAKHSAWDLMRYIEMHEERLGFQMRATTIGHVQRGGTPGAFDRILGTRFGVGAVDRIVRGETGVLVGLIRNEVTSTPLSEVVAVTKEPNLKLLDFADLLAR